MKSESSSSDRPSATTSTSGPATPAGEAEYLSQQEKEAREAIERALNDLKSHLANGLDPRAWVQERPWTTVGSAVAAGFFVAWGLVPSHEQVVLKRLERIERVVAGEHEPADENGRSRKKKKSLAGGLAGVAFSLLKPALMSALSSAVAAKAKGAEEDSAATGGPEAASDAPAGGAEIPPHS